MNSAWWQHWLKGLGLAVCAALLAGFGSWLQDGSLNSHDLHAALTAIIAAIGGYLVKSPITDSAWDGTERRVPTQQEAPK